MIKMFSVNMPKTVDKPLLKVLHSGYITQGPKVEEFERKFGAFIGNDNVVSVNSGTSALTLALRLAGVGVGDEVITTPMTCSATNLPILTAGARPVFADVNPDTGLISVNSVLELINPNTKAIMVCDWGGMPCNLDALMKIAEEYEIFLIEDAAHALGAYYKDRPVGSIAHFTCFSFQAIKHMSTGDGGALACLNPEHAARGKKLRWFGIDRSTEGTDTRINEDIEEAGYKFHMNDIDATIGIVQLDHISKTLAEHREIARFYNTNLPPFYGRPQEGTNRSAWWLYTLTLPSEAAREGFKKWMQDAGIQVSQVHRRNDDYTVFEGYKRFESQGLADFSERMVCIPIHVGLGLWDVAKISEECIAFAKYWEQEV